MSNWSNRGVITAGILVLALGGGGFAAWAAATQINGAVVASGRVQVEARHQTVQHRDGGLVAEILVREGQRVQADETLIRLDGEELQARNALLTRNLMETLVRMDRLLAEATDASGPVFREELAQAAQDPDIAKLLADERDLFESRRVTIAQTDAALDEQITQTRAGIEGYLQRMQASQSQFDLIEKERLDQESLLSRGLTQFSRVSALSREAAQLQGELGELTASVAEARSALAGYEIERLHNGAKRREDARSQFRELQPREIEIRENLRITRAQLGRLDIRAPMAGRVLNLTAHTLGGVIAPGADILSIVPEDTPLVFSVRIDPGQVDRARVGQSAEIRFPNFNSRETPSFMGTVEWISADTISDQATGQTYYTADLRLDAASAQALEAYRLQPGMPLEAFLQTDARSPASYLLKPLMDYASYAMREE